MKNSENTDYLPTKSSKKSWLIGIWSFLVALNILRLISTVAGASGSGIGVAILSLALDGVMLTAIFKQWKVVLNIGRILMIIEMISYLIVIVFVAIVLNSSDFTETQKKLAIFGEVGLGVVVLINGALVLLVGRYIRELESPSYA